MDPAGTLTPMITSSGWWRAQGRRFLLAVALVALAVVLGGWFTGARQVMHAALLGVAVVAFLPFLVIGAGILLALLVAAVATVAAVFSGDAGGGLEGAVEGGGAVVGGGGWLLPRYYRFLGRRRHPAFWGGLCGVLLGGLLLWGLLAILVVPGEARTVTALAAAQARLEQRYAADGGWPRPQQGQLVLEGEPLRDGFGRPLRYEVSGRWKLASWRLRSTGYDGVVSGDDLCIAGASRLVAMIEQARDLVGLLGRVARGEGSTSDRLAGVRALGCAD